MHTVPCYPLGARATRYHSSDTCVFPQHVLGRRAPYRAIGVKITGQTKSVPYEHARYLQFAWKQNLWDNDVAFRVDPTFTDEQIATATYERDFGTSHRPSWTTTAGVVVQLPRVIRLFARRLKRRFTQRGV